VPVTVVVVNCNGGGETLKCLRSVAASDPPPDRSVLVDNGSTDGTRDLIEKEYRGAVPLSTIWLSDNVGPAAARNIGVASLTSPFVAFLDNDTTVCPTWLKAALETMAAFQADCAQCKLVFGTDIARLDSLGYLLGPFGFPRHIVRPGAAELPAYQRPRLIFGVKSAAMIIAKDAFESAGGFDPSFFIYGEETDLCWRLLRMGRRIVLAPDSVVFHNAGGTGRYLPNKAEALLYRAGTRNYIRVVAKNSPPRRVFIDLVGQISVWLGMAGLNALRGRLRSCKLILQGVVDGVVMLPDAIRARRQSPIPYVETSRELRMPFNFQYFWHTVKEMTGG